MLFSDDTSRDAGLNKFLNESPEANHSEASNVTNENKESISSEKTEQKNKLEKRPRIKIPRNQNNSSVASENNIDNKKNHTVIANKKNKEKNYNYNKFQENIPIDDLIEKAIAENKVKDIDAIKSQRVTDLAKLAEELNIDNFYNLSKKYLIFSILTSYQKLGYQLYGSGILDIISSGGFGFLRSFYNNYRSGPDDIYISPNQIKKLGARVGSAITCWVRPPKKNEKYLAFVKLKIDNEKISPKNFKVLYDNLTPIHPDQHIKLESDDLNLTKPINSPRIIDLIAPIGFGQKALIVAPPKSGKTVLMHDLIHAIEKNHPKAIVMVLLIDERPEEVTEMERSIKGEVLGSTFDEPATRHVELAELAIEKAKRLVENGEDVIIFLDSLTRLARAYNTVIPSSGKVLSGGVDSNALQKPKRFFGAARNLEFGGSLTIVATALVETGSRMDEVIFEEFKGTGNCEIILSRDIANKRLFPAIDITSSGTRKEELLVDKEILSRMWMLRKYLHTMDNIEAMEFLQRKLKNTKNNNEFFDNMNS